MARDTAQLAVAPLRGRVAAARSVALGLLMVLASACSTTASNNYQDMARNAGEAIRASTLGPGDTLAIRVYQDKAMSGVYEVDRDGGFDFPYAGHVVVEGLTASQVGRLLQRKLANGYYRDPHVMVSIKSLNSKKIFVLGQVKKPGRFRYVDNMSVVEAITLAAGFAALAERNYVIVTRRSQRIPVPVEKIMQGLAPNFLVRPGDLIYVPKGVLAQ